MYIKYYCASTNYNSCVHCSNLLIRIGESEQQKNVTLGQYSHNRMSSIRKFQMINIKKCKSLSLYDIHGLCEIYIVFKFSFSCLKKVFDI